MPIRYWSRYKEITDNYTKTCHQLCVFYKVHCWEKEFHFNCWNISAFWTEIAMNQTKMRDLYLIFWWINWIHSLIDGEKYCGREIGYSEHTEQEKLTQPRWSVGASWKKWIQTSILWNKCYWLKVEQELHTEEENEQQSLESPWFVRELKLQSRRGNLETDLD